jgi:hypothetical protein
MNLFNLILIVVLISVLSACGQITQSASPTPTLSIASDPSLSPIPSPVKTSTPAMSATDIWQTLLGRTPVAWTTPLPLEQTTILDSLYVKLDPRIATPFPCKRCPDYALEGGLWKLLISSGVFKIYYTLNGWRSLGSYSVSGNQLYLFNDPYCTRDVGIYSWRLEDGVLTLTEVDDPCSQGLRAANLTFQPWISCRPSNLEAMITDHWQKPTGCDPNSE